MRYLYAACAVILMSGCAGTTKTSTASEAVPGQQSQSQPVVSTGEMQAPQPAAKTLAKVTSSETINVVEVRHEKTNSLINELDGLSTGHQTLDPLQCLIAWEKDQHNSNPWLKTCDASPTIN
jgi:hypothetical protein